MKCLEKRPAGRWQSADEVLARLEHLLTHGGLDRPVTDAHRVTPERLVRRLPSSWRRWRYVTAAVAIAAAGVFAIARVRARDEPRPPVDPGKIVVVPFRTLGIDSSLQYLGEGVVDLLAAKLTGEGGPLAVESRTAISAWNRVTAGQEGTADHARRVARLVGAGEALSGTFLGVPGNRVTITANVIPSMGGAARPAVTVTGPVDSLASLLDAIATRLVARNAGVTDQTLSSLTSASLPALRAYLWGRAEYRRGHDKEAIEHFARAVELDSSFALAALDLVVATGQPLGMGNRTGPSAEAVTTYFALGFRNPGPDSDHRRIARAFEVAWRYREKLSARDRPLLEALRGDGPGRLSTARRMINDLQRAAAAAPERVETQYLLGSLLLFQGGAVEIGDARSRAKAAFTGAHQLDPAYAAPIAGLVEIAAFDRDTAALRKAGDLYIALDSVGNAADYVRWRVAAGLGDVAALSSIRARFDAIDSPTLQRIVHASLMSGLDLTDAVRATSTVVDRASDPIQRKIALASAYMLAMNRGRPKEAADLLARRAVVSDDPLAFWTWAAMAALFWDGDTALARSVVRDRSERIARDTLRSSRDSVPPPLELTRHISQQALWDLMHGDTARAAAAVRWLRRNNHPWGADLVEVVPVSQSGRPDAQTLRSRLDSIALEGCCAGVVVHWSNIVIARAYEAAGRDSDALRAVRRGVWRFPPQLLSTFLREEGRLAAKVGDRRGAIRAYRHYLALRSDPEPELRPEADRVREELARLERSR
jgi:tetratricopeptide (TPR) repeat protein